MKKKYSLLLWVLMLLCMAQVTLGASLKPRNISVTKCNYKKDTVTLKIKNPSSKAITIEEWAGSMNPARAARMTLSTAIASGYGQCSNCF